MWQMRVSLGRPYRILDVLHALKSGAGAAGCLLMRRGPECQVKVGGERCATELTALLSATGPRNHGLLPVRRPLTSPSTRTLGQYAGSRLRKLIDSPRTDSRVSAKCPAFRGVILVISRMPFVPSPRII